MAEAILTTSKFARIDYDNASGFAVDIELSNGERWRNSVVLRDKMSAEVAGIKLKQFGESIIQKCKGGGINAGYL